MTRLLLIPLLLSIACTKPETKPAATGAQAPQATVAGDATQGRKLIADYGCTMCHAVPGVEGMAGSLGPSLAGIGSRPAISGGAVQNTPANLVAFIQRPDSLNPQSSMPPTALTPQEAQHVAAYLMTLR